MQFRSFTYALALWATIMPAVAQADEVSSMFCYLLLTMYSPQKGVMLNDNSFVTASSYNLASRYESHVASNPRQLRRLRVPKLPRQRKLLHSRLLLRLFQMLRLFQPLSLQMLRLLQPQSLQMLRLLLRLTFEMFRLFQLLTRLMLRLFQMFRLRFLPR